MQNQVASGNTTAVRAEVNPTEAEGPKEKTEPATSSSNQDIGSIDG
jgi:hypothetical protein